jgi:hypothetical protein
MMPSPEQRGRLIVGVLTLLALGGYALWALLGN